MSTVPIAKPSLIGHEMQYVVDAISNNWISSSGEYITQLEHAFANFCETKHCILTSNGTVALHLALVALGIGAGDEVIIPDLTFAATANAVILAGAKPVIVDARLDDWCIDPKQIELSISSRTKAIIPVHLYGHPCDMSSINALAEKYKLKVIEDAAEAHGARYQNRRVGGVSDCATFSFYGNKIMTTGEGGCITTNSDYLAQHARMLRDHGMNRDQFYWHEHVGFNYRMTNMQAAIGLAQLERIDEFISDRKRILDTYKYFLLPHGFIMNPMLKDVEPVNWMVSVLFPEVDVDVRDKALLFLKQNHIETRPFFNPLTTMPIYEGCHHPISLYLSRYGLNLPTFYGLEEEVIARISRLVVSVLSRITV